MTPEIEAALYDQQYIGLPEFGGATAMTNGHYGDCLRASVATVLQRDPSTLQHYVERLDVHWVDAMNEDVAAIGMEWVVRPPLAGLDGNSTPTGWVVAFGDSPRGNGVTHAVVWNPGGGMVHDPHPSRDGLTCIRGAYVLVSRNSVISAEATLRAHIDSLTRSRRELWEAADDRAIYNTSTEGITARLRLRAAVEKLRGEME